MKHAWHDQPRFTFRGDCSSEDKAQAKRPRSKKVIIAPSNRDEEKWQNGLKQDKTAPFRACGPSANRDMAFANVDSTVGV